MSKATTLKLRLGMGGLLGLAGLGFLPQEAQAAPGAVPVEPDPSGVALADDPAPVVVPEPSAQPTEPELDELATPQPSWTAGVDEVVVAAAAATAAEATPQEPGAIAPETAELPPAPTTALWTNGTTALPAPGAEATGEAEAAVSASLVHATAETAPQADVSPAAATAPAAERSLSPSAAAAPTESLAAIAPESPSMSASAPTPDSTPPSPGVTSTASTLPTAAARIPTPAAPPQPLDVRTEVSRVAVPSPASPTASPARRPAAADVAALRARAATITALLQDIRTAAGLETPDAAGAAASPARPVTQPETLSRGPQLPPLPARFTPRAPQTETPSPLTTAAPTKPTKVALPLAALPSSPAAPTQRSARPGPQLPPLPNSAPNSANVALALPAPQPMMSAAAPLRVPQPEQAAPAQPVTQPTTLPEPGAIAQTAPQPDSPVPQADQIRQDLQVAPLTTAANPAFTYAPSPNAGIPSAFGAQWGDFFISASLAGADRLRPEADGSLSMGFGLGDAQSLVGVELAYNLLSIRNFGENGSFDIKVHRQIYGTEQAQVAAAAGLTSAFPYGSNAVTTESSPYGIVSAAQLLQPDHPTNRLPITGSLGVGGGNFAGENSDVGIIAGVGLQVHPQFSVNTAWSGVGLNVGASIVPEPRLPISLNLLYGDVFNDTRAGSVAVISIGYGVSSAPRFQATAP